MKIPCACGFIIHDGADELPHKAHLLPDQEWGLFWTAVDNAIENAGPSAAEKEAACMELRRRSFGRRLLWQCPQCGRLYIDDSRHALQCFEPAAATTPRNILASAPGEHREQAAPAISSEVVVMPTKHAILMVGAVALTAAGLTLAFLSDPSRFPPEVYFDRYIRLLAAAGLGCTLAGVGLLLAGLHQATRNMPPETRTRANVGVGSAVAFQLAGLLLARDLASSASLAGLALVVAGQLFLLWGCFHYATGKGYSRLVGLAGLAGILGLVALAILPNRLSRSTSGVSGAGRQ